MRTIELILALPLLRSATAVDVLKTCGDTFAVYHENDCCASDVQNRSLNVHMVPIDSEEKYIV